MNKKIFRKLQPTLLIHQRTEGKPKTNATGSLVANIMEKAPRLKSNTREVDIPRTMFILFAQHESS